MKLSCFFKALFVLAGVVGSADAGVILSNLPGSGTYQVSGQGLTATTWAAVGLTTSSTAESFVSFRGMFNTPLPAIAEGGIFSNVSGHPGSLLAAFTNVNVPANGTPTSYTLNTASPFTLQPSTSYWFVLHDLVPFAWNLDNANSNTGNVPTAAAGYTFNGYRTTTNSGGIWSNVTGNWTVQITTAAVPEPSGLVLAGCAMVGLRFVRRRRAVPCRGAQAGPTSKPR